MVRVHTDEDVIGIGQTAPYHAGISAKVVHEMVAPFFLGRDPWDVEALVDECLRVHYKFAGSFLHRAVAGVDTALWDILGKSAGVPVTRLIGGMARTEVPMYGSSMLRSTTAEEEVERLLAAVETHGFRGVKLRVGDVMGRDTDASPGRTAVLVPRAREALGSEISIAADANGGCTPAGAIRLGRLLEEHEYFHFEEPCPFDDVEGTRQVADALDIPVAGGEQDWSLPKIAEMLTRRAVDILQPDIGYVGGVSRARKVAALAEAAGIPCTPHCANDSLLQVFTLHLAAAVPGCTQLQEWSIETAGWSEGIYGPMLTVVDGAVTVPTSPGWGVELDPVFVRTAELATSRA